MEKGLNGFFPQPERRMLRRMGLLRDQQGILNRYFREERNWHEHIDQSRNFILEWLAATRPEKLMVLGSGWLLDFPLEEASRLCPSIVLADLNHPPQVDRKVRNYAEVTTLTADITGGLLELSYRASRSRDKNPEELVSDILRFQPSWQVPEGTSFLSLNLLSQLDTLIVDFLTVNKCIQEKEVRAVRAKIQADHLRLLQNSRFCLITDYYEIHEHRNNQVPEEKDLLHINLPHTFEKEWLWKFDTHGLYKPAGNTLFKVGALSS